MKYITTNSDVSKGLSCARGTRIPISTIEYLAFQEYCSEEQIVKIFPELSIEIVQNVMTGRRAI